MFLFTLIAYVRPRRSHSSGINRPLIYHANPFETCPVMPAYPRFPPAGPNVAINDRIDLRINRMNYHKALHRIK